MEGKNGRVRRLERNRQRYERYGFDYGGARVDGPNPLPGGDFGLSPIVVSENFHASRPLDNSVLVPGPQTMVFAVRWTNLVPIGSGRVLTITFVPSP